ncbi:MAG: antitoxin [Gammaproteobacteria bacterium]|nr:antitoxin [Gammaproteobacteria bacterium]MYE99343.1 antitoxin [Gammaproteobacteria bacterium]
MRTTLDLDADVLMAAKELAQRQQKTAGQIVSQLLRQALNQDSGDSGETGNYGFRPFASRGGVVTNTLINELREDFGD